MVRKLLLLFLIAIMSGPVLAESTRIIKLRNPIVWQQNGLKLTATHIGRNDHPDYGDPYMFLLVKFDASKRYDMEPNGTLVYGNKTVEWERYIYPDAEDTYMLQFPILPKNAGPIKKITGKMIKRADSDSQLVGPYTLAQLKDGVVFNNGMLAVGLCDWRYGSWTNKWDVVSFGSEDLNKTNSPEISVRILSAETASNDMTVSVSQVYWADGSGISSGDNETEIDNPEDPIEDEVYAGFYALDCTDRQKGARVIKVLASSPAEKAGLMTGDVITAMNGKAIKGADSLNGCWEIGKTVNLKVLRNEKPSNIALKPEAVGIWSGITPDEKQIFKKLQSKLQPSKSGYKYHAYCSIICQSTKLPKAPESIELFTSRPGKVLKQAEFKFNNIAVPAGIYK